MSQKLTDKQKLMLTRLKNTGVKGIRWTELKCAAETRVMNGLVKKGFAIYSDKKFTYYLNEAQNEQSN